MWRLKHTLQESVLRSLIQVMCYVQTALIEKWALGLILEFLSQALEFRKANMYRSRLETKNASAKSILSMGDPSPPLST